MSVLIWMLKYHPLETFLRYQVLLIHLLINEPITNDEVYLQLSHLNPWKASGPDNLPNKFLKLLAPIISPLLASIFNECFEVGKFPATLKQA